MNLTKLNMSTYLYFGIGMIACSFVLLYVNSFYLKIVLLSLVFLYLHFKINNCMCKSNKRSLFTQLSDDDEKYQDRKVLRNRSTSLDDKYIVYDRNGKKRCIRHDSVYDHTNSKSNLIDDETSDSLHSRQTSCSSRCSRTDVSSLVQNSKAHVSSDEETSQIIDDYLKYASTREKTDNDDNNSSSDQDDNNSSSDQDDNNSSSDQDETPVLKICEEQLACLEHREEISQILQRGTSEETSVLERPIGSEESTKEAVVENKKITDDMMTKKPKHEFERQSTYYLCE